MNDSPHPKRKVLLTGAAGGIGSGFFRQLTADYAFRLADLFPIDLPEPTDHESIILDVSNPEACQEACKGIDTVVHLAGDRMPEADFLGSLLDNNIKGTYNIFRAAKDQGCRRVIYASSVQTLLGYQYGVQLPYDSVAKPLNMYGVSKCFGEAAASYFAHAEGLSCIAVRIGAYDMSHDPTHWLRTERDPLNLPIYVSPRDLNQLFTRCVDVPDVTFAIVYGISNNRFKREDLAYTRSLLGYEPQDDAFEIFRDELHMWLK